MRSYFVILISLAALFIFDLFLPLGIAASISYIIPILITLKTKPQGLTIQVAIACTILTILGYFWSPHIGQHEPIIVANRILTLLSIWTTAFIVAKIKSVESKLLWNRLELQKEVDKRTSELKTFKWMADPDMVLKDRHQDDYPGQNYGDLVQLNTNRTIVDSVGKEILEEISKDYLDLLDSSGAIYEKNGDYALGIFSSGWCRFMDQSSRDLCNTTDDNSALNSGQWHCHESCWQCSNESMETGRPVDIECNGGIRLYAVPIISDGETIGSINFGYGDPPKEKEKLYQLSVKYGVTQEALEEKSSQYKSRPPFVIDLAKKKLETAAKLIGELVSRKRTQEQLERSRSDLLKSEVIIRSAIDGIITIDTDSIIESVNPAAARLFGYCIDELVGNNLTMLMPEEYRSQHERGLENYLKTGQAKIVGTGGIEVPGLRKNGTTIPLHVTLAKVQLKDKMLFTSILHDMTTIKEAEQRILQSNSDLEQFAYIVSHDLQEPLRSISGFSHLLVKEIGERRNETIDKYLRFIINSSERMKRLINDLLRYSRIGRANLSIEMTDLNNIITRVKNNLSQQIDDAQVEIEYTLPSIRCDQSQITQLFQNLISNAIKFKSNNSPKIIISYEKHKNKWQFCVSDNGVGIDKKYHEKIFEVFQRSDEQRQGTGVGLAICQQIVKRHDGEIWVKSSLGQGSEFYFTIKD